MSTFHRILVGVLICSTSFAAKAGITSTLDRDHVGVGDVVELTLERDHSSSGQPDLSPLKKDFDVIGTTSGTSIQIINGQISEHADLKLSLSPKHAGDLQIPPLTWGGETSVALNLSVDVGSIGRQSGTAAISHSSSHAFITSTLDQKQPYVQGAALLTVQVHTDQALSQASLDFSGTDDVSVQQIGRDRQSSEVRGGHPFDVVQRQYLLLPQKSGEISLDGPVLDAQVAENDASSPFGDDPFFGKVFGGIENSMRPLRIHAEPIKLSVRPRPAGYVDSQWLPAKEITLTETWQPEHQNLHADEPLTLHLGLRAVGLTAAQLPDLSSQLSVPDGMKAYPDQAKLETDIQSGAVVGTREQDIALIAGRAGHYRIPALRLSWWDITQGVRREEVLPERIVDVLPAADSSSTVAPISPSSSTRQFSQADSETRQPPAVGLKARAWSRHYGLWLGLLSLGAIAFWWSTSKGTATLHEVDGKADSPKRGLDKVAQKAFIQACQDNDPNAARKSLLAWAKSVWGTHAPIGLSGFAERLDDKQLADLLSRLDRACYTGGAWQGDQLARALTRLSKRESRSAGKTPILAALYGLTAE